MLQTLFYISHDGEEIGPLSLEDVRQSLQDKKLSEVDYIYVEEREDWLPLGEFLKEDHEGKTPVSKPTTERRKSASSEDFINLLPDEPAQLAPESATESDLAGKMNPSVPARVEPSDEGSPHIFVLAPEPPPPVEAEPQEKTADTQVLHQDFSLHKGSTEILLEDLRPGRVELLVTLDGDQAAHREEIKVQGGDPAEIKIHLQPSWKATDEKLITFEVCDEFGEPCTDFSGSINFQIQGEPAAQVTLRGPKTEHRFECHRSGVHSVKFHNSTPTLRHPEALSVEVLPGEPTSLKVHSEGTPRAGQPHKVKIQAFDAFGNLATTFDGPLKIEVLEHPTMARPQGVPSLKILPLPKKTG